MSLPKEQVVSLIVSQLKQFGYYTAAKQIGDSIGLQPEPSNKLNELLSKSDIALDDSYTELVQVPEFVDDVGHLVFEQEKLKSNNIPYQPWFTTQHRGSCRASAFSLDGNYLATGSSDTSLKVLDTQLIVKYHGESSEEKKVFKTLYDHTEAVNETVFHPNGAVLASCADDFNIKFFDLQKQNSKRAFRYLPDSYPVRSISFHPSGEFIISGTDHHAVRLFDIQTMKVFIPSNASEHHQAGITKVRYASNGNMFASCSIDGSIKLYDTVTSRCVNTINNAHDGASIIGIQFSKSCAYLLSTGLDGKGKLWDMSSGNVLCTYEGALQRFDHAPMSFTYNEDFVVGTDASNHSICIWDSQTGEIVKRIRGVHDSPIRTISCSPVDQSFVTGGEDCRARFWNYSTQ
ncbi:WD40-repeat-containing domain protein [Globomyces pollinis-pini]|nr:WD40-repeat-containing domain protein [Globomyces pollinis-pini]